jgi:type IV pilus assembly protein PilC
MLHVPLVKTFLTVGEIINFTSIMSLSLGAGISILQALTLAINSSKNIVFKEKLFLVYNMVSEGRGLGESLRAIKFDDYAVNLTTMGETTGRLPEALDKVAKYYTKEIDDVSKKLTDVLPLIILVLVGGMVGYMMVNMLMPIFDMSQSMR